MFIVSGFLPRGCKSNILFRTIKQNSNKSVKVYQKNT